MLAAELAVNGAYVCSRFEYNPVSYHRDNLQQLRQAIAGIDDEAFYRVETETFFVTNQPLLCGYSGLNIFSSAQDTANDAIVAALGYNWVWKDPFRVSAAANALLSLRCLVSADGTHASAFYERYSEAQELTVYRSRLSLPFAFAVDDPQAAVWGAGAAESLGAIYDNIAGWSGELFKTVAAFEATEEGSDLCAVPGEYHFVVGDGAAVSVTAGGQTFGSEEGRDLLLGELSAGDEICFTAEQPCDAAVLLLDAERFGEAVAAARAGDFGAEVCGGTVRISYDCDEPQTVLLSMPYVAGLSCEAAEGSDDVSLVRCFEWFTEVSLPAGQSVVTVRYRPAGQNIGIALSAIAAAAFVLLAARELRRGRLLPAHGKMGSASAALQGGSAEPRNR